MSRVPWWWSPTISVVSIVVTLGITWVGWGRDAAKERDDLLAKIVAGDAERHLDRFYMQRDIDGLKSDVREIRGILEKRT